ncbi:MAG: hypothetical protein DRJ64_02990, partial [Thermoprotei archaeon]
RKVSFSRLYEKAEKEGRKTKILDTYHLRLEVRTTTLSSTVLRNLFKLGYIGAEIQNGKLTSLYLPMLSDFKPEIEYENLFENKKRKRVPSGYWWRQFLEILESKEGGITEENLRNIGVMDFKPWNGKRIRSEILAKMRLKAKKLFLEK